MFDKESIIRFLSQIPDPEIPVISIVDLGVIRDVKPEGNGVEVVITPTYSGCPAMKQMEDDIRSNLRDHGFGEVKITTTYNPPWTTDWLSESSKKKLQDYGIAPPEESTTDKSFLTGKPKTVTCPHCKSRKTHLVSQFGSTACKALYKCDDCLEAFDYFKCI